jgi:hypothetical protein
MQAVKGEAMKFMTFSRVAVAAAACALVMTACGGGDGDGPVSGTPVAGDPAVPGSDVPLSATTSSAAALAFVKGVAAASSDTADPITVGDALLASSETDEPDPGI